MKSPVSFTEVDMANLRNRSKTEIPPQYIGDFWVDDVDPGSLNLKWEDVVNIQNIIAPSDPPSSEDELQALDFSSIELGPTALGGNFLTEPQIVSPFYDGPVRIPNSGPNLCSELCSEYRLGPEVGVIPSTLIPSTDTYELIVPNGSQADVDQWLTDPHEYKSSSDNQLIVSPRIDLYPPVGIKVKLPTTLGSLPSYFRQKGQNTEQFTFSPKLMTDLAKSPRSPLSSIPPVLNARVVEQTTIFFEEPRLSKTQPIIVSTSDESKFGPDLRFTGEYGTQVPYSLCSLEIVEDNIVENKKGEPSEKSVLSPVTNFITTNSTSLLPSQSVTSSSLYQFTANDSVPIKSALLDNKYDPTAPRSSASQRIPTAKPIYNIPFSNQPKTQVKSTLIFTPSPESNFFSAVPAESIFTPQMLTASSMLTPSANIVRTHPTSSTVLNFTPIEPKSPVYTKPPSIKAITTPVEPQTGGVKLNFEPSFGSGTTPSVAALIKQPIFTTQTFMDEIGCPPIPWGSPGNGTGVSPQVCFPRKNTQGPIPMPSSVEIPQGITKLNFGPIPASIPAHTASVFSGEINFGNINIISSDKGRYNITNTTNLRS
jgi:hypothetical protein